MTTDRLRDAARRALDSLNDLIADSSDPGTEALGARFELETALTNTPVPPPTNRAALLHETADVRPQTLTSVAAHLDARAVAILRPDSQTFAEWQAIAALLRRVAAEEQPAETQGGFELRGTAEIRAAALEEAALIAVAENNTCPAVYQCQPCLTRERVAADLLRAAAKERPAVAEQPDTQETRRG